MGQFVAPFTVKCPVRRAAPNPRDALRGANLGVINDEHTLELDELRGLQMLGLDRPMLARKHCFADALGVATTAFLLLKGTLAVKLGGNPKALLSSTNPTSRIPRRPKV